MATGIKFVKKANMWQFYSHNEGKEAKNIEEWFVTKEQAEKRLSREK